MKIFGRAAALATAILLVATLAPARRENAMATATCARWSTGWTGPAAWTPSVTARR